ncbi:MAG: hypothetical protein SAJ12_18355 [Jaaginema sp. PMC 1079.18]|nr:hypothetical protein [Jaaginema sp. PMC 1080.18]MEC4852948.1 hypothetical protein [Jaaginema sp. PMC 1079.18]MEC4868861.1 hypothetical protein [Jaaginema sp. PMC 1078.18]
MLDFLLNLHLQIGNRLFLIISAIVAIVTCFWFIPITTDLMINCAAGLAGKYWGRDRRTLVINSSTNNPELFSMLVAFSLGRVGGLANPLGSNFANIYLMFIFAPLVVMGKWLLLGKVSRIKRFFNLVSREKGLCFWHLVMSFLMFGFASFAYWCMTGVNPFRTTNDPTPLQPKLYLLMGGISCLVAIFVFFFFENRLKAKRLELFENINEDNHSPSWSGFALGTIGLIICCYILNSFFLAWSSLYSNTLEDFFGAAIFAGLHYFVGSLITSLPEMTVAIENYERLDAADLNTAMASASQSNMTNLAIAALGSILIFLLLLFGINYRL